jgi:hypothetical protein
VCSHLSAALDAVLAGPIRLLSLCAGQGRDVLGVLPGHARRGDVAAVLVESDAAVPAAYADGLPAGPLFAFR